MYVFNLLQDVRVCVCVCVLGIVEHPLVRAPLVITTLYIFHFFCAVYVYIIYISSIYVQRIYLRILLVHGVRDVCIFCMYVSANICATCISNQVLAFNVLTTGAYYEYAPLCTTGGVFVCVGVCVRMNACAGIQDGVRVCVWNVWGNVVGEHLLNLCWSTLCFIFLYIISP